MERLVEKGILTRDEMRQMTSGHAGKLNPEWAEWLMGYMLAFTELLPTPTASDCKGAGPKRFIGGGTTVGT